VATKEDLIETMKHEISTLESQIETYRNKFEKLKQQKAMMNKNIN
jgi:chaperonin cofactor prefoldin